MLTISGVDVGVFTLWQFGVGPGSRVSGSQVPLLHHGKVGTSCQSFLWRKIPKHGCFCKEKHLTYLFGITFQWSAALVEALRYDMRYEGGTTLFSFWDFYLFELIFLFDILLTFVINYFWNCQDLEGKKQKHDLG